MEKKEKIYLLIISILVILLILSGICSLYLFNIGEETYLKHFTYSNINNQELSLLRRDKTMIDGFYVIPEFSISHDDSMMSGLISINIYNKFNSTKIFDIQIEPNKTISSNDILSHNVQDNNAIIRKISDKKEHYILNEKEMTSVTYQTMGNPNLKVDLLDSYSASWGYTIKVIVDGEVIGKKDVLVIVGLGERKQFKGYRFFGIYPLPEKNY